MAKTKHDFVQLTKSYCKQNKTFLGNTTVTDYLGGDLPPGHRPLCGGGRWRMEDGAGGCARGGGLVESPWLPPGPTEPEGRWRDRARAECPIGQSPGATKASHLAGQSMSASGAGRPIGAAKGRDKGRSSPAGEHCPGGRCGPHPAAGANGFAYPPASFHSAVS